MNAPIILISFNRPAYFERVLASLAAQEGVNLSEHQIFLFQDGGVNAYSGKRYASDEVIEENCRLFRHYFPGGTVAKADENLGVALNFERAERCAFVECDAEYAIFLEDDLELGRFYIKTLLQLASLVLKRSDVGYFSVYGQHEVDLVQQRARAGEISPMDHNWGFALTRSQWKKSLPYVEQYLALVRGQDYRDRPDRKIFDLTRSWGCGAPGSSQDVIKTISCYLTGGCKINTVPAFGRYIGEVGLHSNPELFSEMGFAETKVMEDDVFRKSELLDSDLKGAREHIRSFALSIVPAAWERSAGHLAAQVNAPDQVLSVEERIISGLYQGVLGRPPDPSGKEAYLRLFRQQDLASAVRAMSVSLLRSREFEENYERSGGPGATGGA